MAAIFLSYRRTDAPQACRVHDWLAQRFGYDAVFMDVAAIPFAVSYRDFIEQAIGASYVLLALIGRDWASRIQDPGDPVRFELETALARRIPVLPVLIGDAAMPDAAKLPPALAPIALQNASTVGVLHDFDSHMRALLPKLESILAALGVSNAVTQDPEIITRACNGIVRFLAERDMASNPAATQWQIVPAGSLYGDHVITFVLHRVGRIGDVIELHFLLSFWFPVSDYSHSAAGWVMRELERTPFIPEEYFKPLDAPANFTLKVRLSDEDARQIWKMIATDPLRLSLAYVATISPPRTPPPAAPAA